MSTVFVKGELQRDGKEEAPDYLKEMEDYRTEDGQAIYQGENGDIYYVQASNGRLEKRTEEEIDFKPIDELLNDLNRV